MPSAYGLLVDSSPQDFSQHSILVSTQPTALLPLKDQNRRELFGVSQAAAFSFSPGKAADFACSFQSPCDMKSLPLMTDTTNGMPQIGANLRITGNISNPAHLFFT